MTWPPIVELRQYQLHPSRREGLIDLFEARFIESQEQEGMKVIGTFRDLDDDNKLVWLRGFPSMSARRRSLEAFYGGPVWKAHRQRANETMVDSDNVLLLRPARDGMRYTLPRGRPGLGAPETDRGIVELEILTLEAPPDDATIEDFAGVFAARLEQAAAHLLGCLITEESENTFPALPVREGENVLVWLVGYPDRDAFDSALHVRAEMKAAASQWPQLRAIDGLRLTPTARSLLDGKSPASTDRRTATRKERLDVARG